MAVIVVRRLKVVIRKVFDRLVRAMGYDLTLASRISARGDLIKLGSKYGGWVVPQSLLDQNSICYCVGCGEDITFDLALISEFQCQVVGFDPTPRAIAHVERYVNFHSNYHFVPKGIWDRAERLRFYVPRTAAHVSHSLVNLQMTEDYILVDVEPLLDAMADLGHSQLDILKLDIEGAEYRVLKNILVNAIRINVLCVEFDECFNPLDGGYRERIRTAHKELVEAGYALVHSQGYGNYTYVHSRCQAA